jgi:hypothetical protein
MWCEPKGPGWGEAAEGERPDVSVYQIHEIYFFGGFLVVSPRRSE